MARQAIAGIADVITPAVGRRAELYAHARCPDCGSADLDVIAKPLNPTEVVPLHHLRCQRCHMLFDPKSGLILRDSQPVVKPDLQ